MYLSSKMTSNIKFRKDKRAAKWFQTRIAEMFLLIIVDIIAFYLAYELPQRLIESKMYQAEGHIFGIPHVYLAFSTIAVIWFGIKGHYTKRRPQYDIIRDIIKVSIFFPSVQVAAALLQKAPYTLGFFPTDFVVFLPLIIGMRFLVKLVCIRGGGWIRPMVIVGWGENAISVARAFDQQSSMGFRLVAFHVPQGKVMPSNEYRNASGLLIPWVPFGLNLEEWSASRNVHVVVAMEQGGIDEFQEMIQRLSQCYSDVQIVPSLRGLALHGMRMDHFFSHEILLLSMRNNLAQRGKQLLKRAFDLIVSTFCLLLGSPVILSIGLYSLISKKPAFFGHERVGQYGKPFLCYKFRTMRIDAQAMLATLLLDDPVARAEWERDFKLKNDPRITPFGSFLRRSSMDELPQLWNVLKGEMSLVGPRPIVFDELARYGERVEYYLQAKPGITGLWQISGRNDISYDARVNLDAWYAKNWSLINDIGILFQTIKVIFSKNGAY